MIKAIVKQKTKTQTKTINRQQTNKPSHLVEDFCLVWGFRLGLICFNYNEKKIHWDKRN